MAALKGFHNAEITQKASANRLCGFWSSLGAGGDFKAQLFGRCGRPCFISKRRASIDAAADGRELSVCLQ